MPAHVLVIGNASELEDFEAKTSQVSQKITKLGDSISVEELRRIFGNLDIYSNYPTDKKLLSVDGMAINTHEIMMDSLEAGMDAYDSRRQG